MELNPHQFGEQGTLFDAPLGQPDGGLFKGNPHARLYRTVAVHPSVPLDPQSLLDHVTRPRRDGGHDTNMGIHWQHDLESAHEWGNIYVQHHNPHGSDAVPVIIEADHPGHEHIINTDTDWERKTLAPGQPSVRRAIPSKDRDWRLVHDTIGPHEEANNMVAEVPVRPGAPMRVHAIHTPDPEMSGAYIRNPVQFKGIA